MRGRRFFLLCLVLLALGCVGRVLLRPKEVPPSPYTVTVSLENFNALLLPALPEVGDAVTLEGVKGRVTGVVYAPCELLFRESGESVRTTSRLFARATVTVSLSAHEASGRLVLGTRTLFFGDTLSLVGDNFVFSGRFWGADAAVPTENA